MLDLDNTLADRETSVRAWAQEFVEDHGLDTEAANWILEQDNDGYSSRQAVFESIHDHFRIKDSVENLLSRYQRRIIELAVPLVGASGCLVRLRAAGFALAIVTNGSSQQQHGKIDVLGFRELVDAVCVSGELGTKKPAPEIFEAAATATGDSLRGAWMVGDSPLHDIVGAQRLGLNTAWIRRGRSWDADLKPPDLTLDTLEELQPGIEGFGVA